MAADTGNFALDQRLPGDVGQNDILKAGASSGLPEYDLSDGFNNQTAEKRDDPINRGNVTPFLESNAGTLLQTRQDRLLQLRAMNPFVPIVMFPLTAKAAVLAANVAQDIPIPSGAKYVILKGTGDYWVSVQGAASVPVASVGLTDDNIAPILRPDDVIFYCEEIKSISVVADAIVKVSAAFYAQQ